MVPDRARLTADEVVKRALARYPKAVLKQYRLPRDNDRTAEVDVGVQAVSPPGSGHEHHLGLGNDQLRLWIDVFSGEVLHEAAPDDQLTETIKRLHGELLSGDAGSIVVELAASWMIILIITGCYLYWPRDRSWRQVFLPNLSATRGRQRLYALHGAVASWAAAFILIFLFSGLSWSQVWGGAFKWSQDVVGVPDTGQEWFVTLKSSPQPTLQAQRVSLQSIIDTVNESPLHPPVLIKPPKPQGVWTVRSLHPNRANRVTLHFDQWTGEQIMRIDFASKHWFKRLVSHGVSLHEGHLFGPLNHLLAMLVALCVITISVTGPWMWWRRRASGQLAAPALPADYRIASGVVLLIVLLAVLLPTAGVSMLIVALGDFLWSKLNTRSAG